MIKILIIHVKNTKENRSSAMCIALVTTQFWVQFEEKHECLSVFFKFCQGINTITN